MGWTRLGATATVIVGVLTACEAAPPTPSDQILLPYQFIIEFSIEQEYGLDHTARARLYDITQAYDLTGGAGTIALAGGDALYAHEVKLDTETTTTLGTVVRVDYSQTIPAGEADYGFELRRPDDERIEATIPIPPDFEIDPIGELERFEGPWTEVTWSEPIEGALIDISIHPVTDDCITIIGGGDEGHVVYGADDTGSYRVNTGGYHSATHDCTYEFIVKRRYAEPVSGNWHVRGRDVPSQDIWAHGQHTERVTFVALKD